MSLEEQDLPSGPCCHTIACLPLCPGLGLCRETQSSQDRVDISLATCMSSCHKRNAISSSYSSTGGLPVLKRRTPGPSNCEVPLVCSSSPGIPPKKAHCEKVAEGRVGQSAQEEGFIYDRYRRPQKRKFPLLLRHPGEPLRLSPPHR
ncbi:hypothetical protein SUZIE_200550 [Sciurus carolinensis]|uniref:Uncharacterized protein n=1 Tax=Sciurus carolinensis TaxID=30640 RepID=A0AA41NFF3_SCICA|nr:hypothetical protein [Sciurus carolinensis]